MEKILKNVIVDFLVDNNLITIKQHGFLKNKSCITNLLETVDLATETINQKRALDIIYLDFAKAFDTVPHKRLLHKLECYSFDKGIISWIQAFLLNRKQRVILGGIVSEWVNVESGVLGSVLFILYINDLPKFFECFCEVFADDTKLISIIKNMD